MVLSKARQKADAKYKKTHPKVAKTVSYRSTAKNFIKNYSNNADLYDLEKLIATRRKELEK